jgi:hypothetical protein
VALAPAWVVRIQVPVGARSRRRLLDDVRAVLDVLRAHPRAGSVGVYDDVSHATMARERFVAPGESTEAQGTVVTLTTYLVGASRAEVDALAREIAAVHPWKHPVIECVGPEGAFLWMPEG